MVSAPVWQPVAVAQSWPHAALRAAHASLLQRKPASDNSTEYLEQLGLRVLPAGNRLRSSSDFARTTKVGHRATSQSLIFYGHINVSHQIGQSETNGPQIGLIISKAVGGSVQRHRIARQLRHLIKEHLTLFPNNTQIVIRVLRAQDSYTSDVKELARKLAAKISTTESTKQP